MDGRADRFHGGCPVCGGESCPRTGERAGSGWITRYRRCARERCGFTFKTMQQFRIDPVSRRRECFGPEEVRSAVPKRG